MNAFRKLLCISVVCTMLLCAMVGCTEQENNEGNNQPLTYTLSEDGTAYEVVAERANNLTTQTITVPATYEGKPVVIPFRAFYGLPELVSVTIEGASGEIATQAFMNCPKLETVVLKGDAVVLTKCFNNCEGLKSITFGDGIKEIGNECIGNCPALETVIIGDDCASIGVKAFANCTNLKNLTLGKGLQKIGVSAFLNNTSLKQVAFPTDLPLQLDSYAFSYAGIEELHIPGNITMGEYVFDHLAWNEEGEYSACKAVYFYSTQPTAAYLGTNSIGYTWDRVAEDDAALGDFLVYVPEGYEDVYENLMRSECDESWVRCILNLDKLATFTP